VFSVFTDEKFVPAMVIVVTPASPLVGASEAIVGCGLGLV
jgi:hypothetical protein